jgi:hypothetical protein
MWTTLATVVGQLRAHLDTLRRDQAGYSTETVVVTALLVLLALTVMAALTAAVLAKVRGIDFGETPPP